MSKNQKFNGLAFHGSHKKALKSSECWELINQLSHETGIDFDSIYVIGFKGSQQGRMIEKNYKANRNSKSAPHHSEQHCIQSHPCENTVEVLSSRCRFASPTSEEDTPPMGDHHHRETNPSGFGAKTKLGILLPLPQPSWKGLKSSFERSE